MNTKLATRPDEDDAGDTMPVSDEMLVTDMNATAKHSPDEAHKDARVHTHMINGRPVNFSFLPGVPLKMPRAHALKFLQPGWMVTDMDGNELHAPPKLGDGGMKDLRPDQVIANLEELTAAALKFRVAAMPGGEMLRKADKVDMIAFITDFAIKNAQRPGRPSEEDEVPEGDLDSIMPRLA